jgi:serine/threonine-protein kinase
MPTCPIKGLTKKDERLANYLFSAPEQLNGGDITFATDIYAFGQILYWFAFGETYRGTGGSHLSDKYCDKRAQILDRIIYRSLNIDPKLRFQDIDQINRYWNEQLDLTREINPFDDMDKFTDAVLSAIPEFFDTITYYENPEDIGHLLNKIATVSGLHRKLWFNTGMANNAIDEIERLDDGTFLINSQQIKIKKVWGSFSANFYDDLLILETENLPPYIIDGKEYYYIAVIDNQEIIPAQLLESGFIRYKGEVVKIDSLQIQTRYIMPRPDEHLL